MEWSAAGTPERPAGGFLDRCKVLRLRGDGRGAARSLRVGLEGERARQQDRRVAMKVTFSLRIDCLPVALIAR